MNTSILKDKKVLITAGPTREAINPVRYISNHSSGKMGYAIADAFLNKISIIKKNGLQKEFCLKDKTEVAKDILSEIGLIVALREPEMIHEKEKELIVEPA